MDKENEELQRFLEIQLKFLNEQHDQVVNTLRQDLVAKEVIPASLQKELKGMKEESMCALTQYAQTMTKEAW